MNKLLPLFILMFVFTVDGQTLAEKANAFNNKRTFHVKNYKVEYDKFKEKTRVYFSKTRIEEGKKSKARAGGVLLSVNFFFDGESLKSDVDEYFLFFEAVCREWCFLENNTLRFIADDKRINIGDGEHNGKIGNVGLLRYTLGVKESIVYKINRTDLTTIANAKMSEFQLGNYEAVLNDKHKRILKNMLALGSSGQ